MLHVLRVFTGDDGAGGNPLGVFLDGPSIPPEQRQSVAADVGFPETVFVDVTPVIDRKVAALLAHASQVRDARVMEEIVRFTASTAGSAAGGSAVATPATPIPSTPIGIAIARQGAAMPHSHVVYNPTPPVKPVAKKSMSCLSVLGLLVLATTLIGLLAAGYIH